MCSSQMIMTQTNTNDYSPLLYVAAFIGGAFALPAIIGGGIGISMMGTAFGVSANTIGLIGGTGSVIGARKAKKLLAPAKASTKKVLVTENNSRELDF